MKEQRKWSGWLLISVITLVAGVMLVMTTLASPQSEPYAEPTQSLQPAPSPEAPAPSAQPVQADSRTANASIMGYGGPVLVRLTLDESGMIQNADIGGARFQETEGLGSRVRDDAFVQSLIGKKPPLELGKDVDAVSGATVSSTAAVEAVNAAYAFLNEKDSLDK